MSKLIQPFGSLRAEIFQDHDDKLPLWEADEVLLLLLLVIDLLILPFALLQIADIGREQRNTSK